MVIMVELLIMLHQFITVVMVVLLMMLHQFITVVMVNDGTPVYDGYYGCVVNDVASYFSDLSTFITYNSFQVTACVF
jgi:hypothetical protein